MSQFPEPGLPNDSLQTPARRDQTEQSVDSSAGIEQREQVVTDQAGLVHSERMVHDVAAKQRISLARTTQLIWLIFSLIEVLIGLRIVLKLIGANPANGFAEFIYNASGLFVGPFITLTNSPASGGMALEIPSIIAMIVYALLGWIIVRAARILWPMFSRSATSSTSTFDRYRN